MNILFYLLFHFRIDPFKLDGVVSSSPSTKSDEYLKNKYSYGDDSSIATIIVSFNI